MSFCYKLHGTCFVNQGRRVARGSKFWDPTRPDPVKAWPDPTRPANFAKF